MNKTLKKLFYQNAAWNTLDALGTQSLVVMHHVLLQIYAGAELHGIIGTVFSILYMAVLVANMGFDFSCAPFMSYYTADTKKFYSFIRTKLAPQTAWICLCAALCFFVLTRLQLSDSTVVPLVLALTFINESIKKTLKILLQLLFYTKQTALIEFMGMIAYLGAVWGWYATGHGISVLSSFFILYVISLCQTACLISALYYWYVRAPQFSPLEEPAHIDARITTSRFLMSAQRAIDQLFSNNFLVPFFAFSCGLTYASYFKIMSSIARWVSLFGDKTFGVTSLMFLSQTPSLSREILPFINRIILITIAIALPLVLSVSNVIGYYYCSVTTRSLIIMCSLLIILRFIDMACIAYERWLLVHERMVYSVSMSLGVALVVYACITYLNVSPVYVVGLLIGARILQAIFYRIFFTRHR